MSTKAKTLKNGLILLVDKEHEHLLNCSWWVDTRQDIRYARDSRGRYLHRIVMGLKQGDRIQVDHINGNGLDCRMENLRIATNAENRRNSKKHSDSTSPYKGVYLNRMRNGWRAAICHQRKQISLGNRFATAEEAALAYNEAALRLHGRFARVNHFST